jgi:hypothetical protein
MKENQTPKLKIDSEIYRRHNKEVKSTMPFVDCTCREKILVVPDVAAMVRALKNHIAKHKNADEQFLIEQIFEVASQQGHS